MDTIKMYTINYCHHYCLINGQVHKLMPATPSETQLFIESCLQIKRTGIKASISRLLKTKVF